MGDFEVWPIGVPGSSDWMQRETPLCAATGARGLGERMVAVDRLKLAVCDPWPRSRKPVERSGAGRRTVGRGFEEGVVKGLLGV